MTRHPLFGLLLALFGALAITPDTLFMRWSAMGGVQMLAWRGLLMGMAFLLAWLIFHRGKLRRDLGVLASGAGASVVACQYVNASLFALGIAKAPVPVVLFGVATGPIFAALFALVLLGEATHWSTWAAIAAVLIGIGIAVFGNAPAAVHGSPVLGAVAGLGVATSLALNFVIIRRNPGLPILLAVGCGALLAGVTALAIAGRSVLDGHLWAIAVTGLAILPVSFFSLSLASRHTQASNVSLVMLLETILGPVWVWAGTGIRPTHAMLTGGVVVVGSLAVYLWYAGRRQARARRMALAQTARRGAL